MSSNKSRKTMRKLKQWCTRGMLVCDRYSLRTAFWCIILLATLGTMFIGASLEENANDLMHRKILKQEANNRLEKRSAENLQILAEKPQGFSNITQAPVKIPEPEVKPKPPKEFDPFKVPEALKKTSKKTYMINWYNAPPYLKLRPDAMNCRFETCEYKNCNITFDRKYRPLSDAVLFDGRWVFEKVGFVRPPGQVWVFAAHEAPVVYEELGSWWKQPQWRHGFNWTMTYDKDNTDIFLPYGELRKRPKRVVRDFKAIAALKTGGALMINSHCNTSSIREKYVAELQKYFPVEVLGKCGTPWNCGTHYVHDDCFKLLNTTYKFFLAFENAFCHQYFSEKLFDNFDYDTIIITRGGSQNEVKSLFPKGTIISTDDFKTIEGLAKYLGKLAWSLSDYAEMLRKKSQYYSVGYKVVYQRALCDLCKRMNNLDKYKKVIPDIVDWAYNKDPCREPHDLK